MCSRQDVRHISDQGRGVSEAFKVPPAREDCGLSPRDCEGQVIAGKGGGVGACGSSVPFKLNYTLFIGSEISFFPFPPPPM